MWLSLPIAVMLLGIGGAGIVDSLLPDDALLLSWKVYPIWPVEYLEDWPFTIVIFIAGALMLLDVFGAPRLLWQRTAIWWLVFFVLWQVAIFSVMSCFGPIKPVGSTAAFLGLSVSYTLVLLLGPPLRVAENVDG